MDFSAGSSDWVLYSARPVVGPKPAPQLSDLSVPILVHHLRTSAVASVGMLRLAVFSAPGVMMTSWWLVPEEIAAGSGHS